MDIIERIGAVGERNRKEYEAPARMTGKSIAEIEADLTAPDPSFADENPGYGDFWRIVESYMEDATVFFHSIAPDMAESVIRVSVAEAVALAAQRPHQQYMCPSCCHSEAWPGTIDKLDIFRRKCLAGHMPNCGRCSHWEKLGVPPEYQVEEVTEDAD